MTGDVFAQIFVLYETIDGEVCFLVPLSIFLAFFNHLQHPESAFRTAPLVQVKLALESVSHHLHDLSVKVAFPPHSGC